MLLASIFYSLPNNYKKLEICVSNIEGHIIRKLPKIKVKPTVRYCWS
jgi:hypothetical protein